MEENHYYPFGLTHRGYNADHKFLLAIDEVIELVEVTSIMDDKYKYKYKGQERQDELGLNWDSFKWRNYDYAIGRFMSIDPLAEKYACQSVYQFASNQPIHANEIEGLENRFDLNMRSYTAEKLSNRGHGNVKENYRAIQQTEASAISKPIKAGASLLNSLIVGGFNFVTGRGTNVGQRKDVDNETKTINVDGIISASPSSANGLNSKGSIVENLLRGVSDATEGVSKFDKVVSNIESTSTKEIDKDTTFTTIKAGSIETNVVSDTQVSSFGNIEKVEVTVPKSQVNSINEASQQSLNKQIRDMDDANNKKMDSLRNARNGS